MKGSTLSLVISLRHLKIRGRQLIDINILYESLNAIEVSQKCEFVLLISDERIEELYNVTNFCLIGIYRLHIFLDKPSKLDMK